MIDIRGNTVLYTTPCGEITILGSVRKDQHGVQVVFNKDQQFMGKRVPIALGPRTLLELADKLKEIETCLTLSN
jgi:hypothetical protein